MITVSLCIKNEHLSMFAVKFLSICFFFFHVLAISVSANSALHSLLGFWDFFLLSHHFVVKQSFDILFSSHSVFHQKFCMRNVIHSEKMNGNVIAFEIRFIFNSLI